MHKFNALRIGWYKLWHWEFWSSTAIYLPIMPVYLYYCIRARSFFFFTSSNPGIPYGGYHLESKWDIYRQLPVHSYPFTVKVGRHWSNDKVLAAARSFQFPVIAKPDIGGKGRGVYKLHSMDELLQYHQHIPVDYLLQAHISYPLELGVFYVFNPYSGKGMITGMVEKQTLTVRGNGVLTVQQLVQEKPRYAIYLPQIKLSTRQSLLNYVPANGERVEVVPIGNHARGAIF
ncbi:MAG TPA: hypothetical protein PKD90_10505, partial [Phnomibacter sp.]|nr:hypothetical protein [Phnomibacter sp.]